MKDRIKSILESQRLAVLATHTGDYPYTSLIVFAHSKDLGQVLFATKKDSRKFVNLARNSLVSLLIDDRQNAAGNLKQASAITIMGEAEVCKTGDMEYASIFLAKNPDLGNFLNLPSVALVKVNVISYLLVVEFEKVYQLTID